MATYAAYRHVELDNVGYGKKRVLKPPGGGSSDIFGSTQDETSPRRVKNHNQSQLGSALFGDATDSSSNSNLTNSGNNMMDNNGGETTTTTRSGTKPAFRRIKRFRGASCMPRNPVTGDGVDVTPLRRTRRCRDGNPVTGTGYTSETQNGGSAMQNGTGSSSSSIGEKSNGSSPTGKPAGTRTRVPPGGYSSGLW
ncbi:PREDICTED: microtubule-associated protein Jupiter isoform X6 [Polistes dominula]|uniref:Microtubule-associated protein Jupiter isoform X6 n=1 Tax=Polistes dominula TaxID=743375 RepID=A0ABM1J103_POLDO|nr:PREDICTED: microtubule-associated protein Jupiter isoform X6 [Polistes dominula]